MTNIPSRLPGHTKEPTLSAHERQAIVSLFTTLLLAVFFVGYLLPRYPTGNPYAPAVFHFWGVAFVILVPVSIVANITVSMVVSMVYAMATREDISSFADERDKFIELRALRNALFVFTAGFSLAMGALAIGMPPSVMFVVLMGSGYGAGLVGNLSQLYLYRQGS
jgi:hypothetical protein